MIWLLLAGFIFVLLLDSYSDGDFDWLIDWVKKLLKKLSSGWLKKQDKQIKIGDLQNDKIWLYWIYYQS